MSRPTRLPSLPSVASRVLDLTEAPRIKRDELAAVVSADPVTAARILRRANSTAEDGVAGVTSIPRAIDQLGCVVAATSALAYTLREGSGASGPTAGAFHARYWRRSLRTAAISRLVAGFSRRISGEEAASCGLLARFGQLVMRHDEGVAYGEVLARAGEELPSAELEQQIIGRDYRAEGATHLHDWALPSRLCDAIRAAGAPDGLFDEIGVDAQHGGHSWSRRADRAAPRSLRPHARPAARVPGGSPE
jgi:HD-like signal output (HDOD) protein